LRLAHSQPLIEETWAGYAGIDLGADRLQYVTLDDERLWVRECGSHAAKPYSWIQPAQ
jgi:hypothetical protein